MTEHEPAIPIDAHPDPVLSYAVEDGSPRVTATNEAFGAAFESVAVGARVASVFERFAVVHSTDDTPPETHLAHGDDAGVYLDGSDAGPYLARIAATDDGTGYVTFVPLDGVGSIAGTAGVAGVTSVLSHDLRNPLDVAEAHLRAARETGADEHFEAVASAHERMERIIQDVLTLARGDEVDPSARISVASAAEDAWASVDTAEATLEMADSLPEATADPDRVRRLFENLFRNSVEHSSTDSRAPSDATERDATNHASVTVTVGRLDDGDGFYVADDGPGIPEAERAAVLDPGYTTYTEGTGLGLAIVERIVAAHGWDLTLASADAGGVRFEVRF